MAELILATFDWVPKPARGFVRDLRVRWALEEAKLPYRIQSLPFARRNDPALWRQPFGQVPWLTDGGLSIFESGAILLHLGERSERLMPADPGRRSEAIQWLFASLNSVEMASLPWVLLRTSADTADSQAAKRFQQMLDSRLRHLETVLNGREWLAGSFSVADIMMADVLRLAGTLGALKNHPRVAAYLARAVARPAFIKAYQDQLAHFAAADKDQRAPS